MDLGRRSEVTIKPHRNSLQISEQITSVVAQQQRAIASKKRDSSFFVEGEYGAGERNRTPDRLITNQMLYLLSYAS